MNLGLVNSRDMSLMHRGSQRVLVENLEKLLLMVGVIDATVRASSFGLCVLLNQHIPSRLLIA
jgi:soluble P-type ATPase